MWRTFIAILVLTVLAEFFIAPHPHFAIEDLIAFNAIYGFAACAALILGAKAIGLLLKRPDNYYDD